MSLIFGVLLVGNSRAFALECPGDKWTDGLEGQVLAPGASLDTIRAKLNEIESTAHASWDSPQWKECFVDGHTVATIVLHDIVRRALRDHNPIKEDIVREAFSRLIRISVSYTSGDPWWDTIVREHAIDDAVSAAFYDVYFGEGLSREFRTAPPAVDIQARVSVQALEEMRDRLLEAATQLQAYPFVKKLALAAYRYADALIEIRRGCGDNSAMQCDGKSWHQAMVEHISERSAIMDAAGDYYAKLSSHDFERMRQKTDFNPNILN